MAEESQAETSVVLRRALTQTLTRQLSVVPKTLDTPVEVQPTSLLPATFVSQMRALGLFLKKSAPLPMEVTRLPGVFSHREALVKRLFPALSSFFGRFHRWTMAAQTAYIEAHCTHVADIATSKFPPHIQHLLLRNDPEDFARYTKEFCARFGHDETTYAQQLKNTSWVLPQELKTAQKEIYQRPWHGTGNLLTGSLSVDRMDEFLAQDNPNYRLFAQMYQELEDGNLTNWSRIANSLQALQDIKSGKELEIDSLESVELTIPDIFEVFPLNIFPLEALTSPWVYVLPLDAYVPAAYIFHFLPEFHTDLIILLTQQKAKQFIIHPFSNPQRTEQDQLPGMPDLHTIFSQMKM